MLVHLAVIQELITRLIPDREAIIWREGVLSYAAFLRRCRQVGHALRTLGLGCHTERGRVDPWESGQDHVAVCMYNCPEWLEVMYGSYHARAVMVNVNYRYKADELSYVLANSGARALVYHAAFAPLVAEVRAALPTLRHLIQMRDDSDTPLLPGALDYEELRARQPTDPLDLPYSPDDLYILYTGGTTGIPKGVLWRQEDVFFNGLGATSPASSGSTARRSSGATSPSASADAPSCCCRSCTAPGSGSPSTASTAAERSSSPTRAAVSTRRARGTPSSGTRSIR